jgi:hypothetical protein
MLTPMGVAGYRVDVRNPARSNGIRSPARGDVLLGDMNLGKFNDEFAVEATRSSSLGKDGRLLASSYFDLERLARARTETALRLAKREHVLAARPFSVPNASEIPDLRYGRPTSSASASWTSRVAAPAWMSNAKTRACEATIRFRRFAPPKGVLLARHSAQLPDQPLSRLSVRRPLLSYPDAVFAGLPNAEALLLADLSNAGDAERSRRAGSRRSPTRNHRGGPAAETTGGRRPERVFRSTTLRDFDDDSALYRPPDRQPGP